MDQHTHTPTPRWNSTSERSHHKRSLQRTALTHIYHMNDSSIARAVDKGRRFTFLAHINTIISSFNWYTPFIYFVAEYMQVSLWELTICNSFMTLHWLQYCGWRRLTKADEAAASFACSCSSHAQHLLCSGLRRTILHSNSNWVCTALGGHVRSFNCTSPSTSLQFCIA